MHVIGRYTTIDFDGKLNLKKRERKKKRTREEKASFSVCLDMPEEKF